MESYAECRAQAGHRHQTEYAGRCFWFTDDRTVTGDVWSAGGICGDGLPFLPDEDNLPYDQFKVIQPIDLQAQRLF